MSKRFSFISIVICALAVVAGALFVPVQSTVYEYENGPNLVSNNFDKLLALYPGKDIACFDKHSNFKGVIYHGSHNSIGFANELEKGIVVQTEVTKENNNKFRLTTWMFPSSNEKLSEYKEFSKKHKTGTFILDELAVNKKLDELHFPNKSLRASQKRELKNKMEESLRNPAKNMLPPVFMQ